MAKGKSTGHKEVLSITIGENESTKYWLNAMNELKNPSVKDIMIWTYRNKRRDKC